MVTPIPMALLEKPTSSNRRVMGLPLADDPR